jgi:hypothetical protein
MSTEPPIAEAVAGGEAVSATSNGRNRRRAAHRPPSFTIGGPAGSSWREQAMARIGEQRTLCVWLRARTEQEAAVAAAFEHAIDVHLDAAENAALGRPGLRTSINGACVDRTLSNLDAVECNLLRLAPASYVRGQMASTVAHVRRHLPASDPRRVDIEALAKKKADLWQPGDVETVIGAVHAASSKGRRESRQVRSFRNTLWATAIVLTLAAGAMALVGILEPTVLPLCFSPSGHVVCPVGDKARGWDVPLIELLGMIAAAVAAAVSLRNVRGTATPYSLPIALAVLKLPTGALTALLGILLMRGGFVPGLSALDSSAQILSWAVVFGYSQQLLTQFVDKQAHSVLDNVRGGGTAPSGPGALEPTASTS